MAVGEPTPLPQACPLAAADDDLDPSPAVRDFGTCSARGITRAEVRE